MATASDVPGAVARRDSGGVLAHEPADLVEVTDYRTHAVAIGDATIVIAYETTNVPITKDGSRAVSVGDAPMAITHKTADIIAGSVDINRFQTEAENRSSGTGLPEQAQVAVALDMEIADHITTAVKTPAKPGDHGREPGNP